MLKPKSPQESFYGSYLYDRIVPVDHLLRKINQVVDFSFADEILKDRYNPDIGRPEEDPEFLLRLCLLQYLYGDSDRQVVENARLNLAYKYFLGLAVDAEVSQRSSQNLPGYMPPETLKYAEPSVRLLDIHLDMWGHWLSRSPAGQQLAVGIRRRFNSDRLVEVREPEFPLGFNAMATPIHLHLSRQVVVSTDPEIQYLPGS